MIHWHLEVIPIKLLKPRLKNPRQISREQFQHLEKVIDKFGLIDKPVINKDHIIIGGHQRVKVLKKMKAKNVECWVPDEQLSEEDLDHLTISLNLNQGHWDFDILANEWDPLDLLTWGFTEEQLVGKFHDIEEIEGKEAKDEKDITKTCPACGHKF